MNRKSRDLDGEGGGVPRLQAIQRIVGTNIFRAINQLEVLKQGNMLLAILQIYLCINFLVM